MGIFDEWAQNGVDRHQPASSRRRQSLLGAWARGGVPGSDELDDEGVGLQPASGGSVFGDWMRGPQQFDEVDGEFYEEEPPVGNGEFDPEAWKDSWRFRRRRRGDRGADQEGDEGENMPGLISSIISATWVNVLTRPKADGSPSTVDKMQQGVVEAADAVARRLGERVGNEIPTSRHVQREVARLSGDLRKVLPPWARQLDQATFAELIDKYTRERYQELLAGNMSHHAATQEEMTIARNLMTELASRDHAYIRERVLHLTFAREQDIAADAIVARLSRTYEVANRAWSAFIRQRERVRYVSDYITLRLMTAGREQEQLQGTLWGMNGRGVEVFSVNATQDRITIPWSFLRSQRGTNGQGVIMIPDYPGYADRLNRAAGGLFRGLTSRAGEQGGIIRFVSLERDTAIAMIAVRNPSAVIEQLDALAKLYRDLSTALQTIQAIVSQQEAEKKPQIRPEVVLSLVDGHVRFMAPEIGQEVYRREMGAIQDREAQLRGLAQDILARARTDGGFTPGGWPVKQRYRRQLEHIDRDLKALKRRSGTLLPPPNHT